MTNFDVKKFMKREEGADESLCVRNTSRLGSACSQWFPTMMKTKITYSLTSPPLSIYDFFADDDLFERMIKYSSRHFQRDSYYIFSSHLRANDMKDSLFPAETAIEWITQFEKDREKYPEWDYWIHGTKMEMSYTGYNELLKSVEFLSMSNAELSSMIAKIPKQCLVNLRDDDPKDDFEYSIRLYKKGQKLFPIAYRAFRTSFSQIASNFPPLTSKLLWEKYTQHLVDKQDKIVVYDPSAGWGGRILGAMTVREDRKIHYVGTDPNPELWDGSESRHANLAKFFNTESFRGNPFFGKTNTFHMFKEGSENIKNNPEFQKYKGKIDMIFTSPPYFNREVYSADKDQSCNKFAAYESWRDGFLQGTLKTCVEWLKSDRYLLWNISDVKYGKGFLPLEKDSSDILESLGMEYKHTIKMILESMPGSGRIDENGVPCAKNSVLVAGKWHRYEPIFVWYKA